MKILVTGGAGFVGSHVVDALIEKGHSVRILDNLEAQVHGQEQNSPVYLNNEAEFIKGDIRNESDVRNALNGVQIVFHLAALVGVGQSMYDIKRYVEINTLGGAVLLDVLVNGKNSVEKVVVASSMSIYGEGAYNCKKCGPVCPKLRTVEQLKDRQWEMRCTNCNEEVVAMPTSEEKLLYPTSIYAITKRDHEEMFLSVGSTYKIPTVALRYFNIYGTRQSISNPYTGVAAIFLSRILNNNRPLIFEDGLQSRDFIHISDLVRANILAMEKTEANYKVFNVGTGRKLSVLEIAKILIKKLNADMEPEVVNKYREGDIRHCYADASRIERDLGFRAEREFESGLDELIEWAKETGADDQVEKATQELAAKGLTW
ncbi:MAG: NAD-dependent epimerase/dehydratase family protein [Candidatus Anammoxibacter sp.]